MTDESNLVDLREEKRKRARPKKMKGVAVYQALAKAINHDELSFLPVFPHRYFIVQEDQGARIIYKEIAPGHVIPVTREFHLEVDLLQYCIGTGEEALMLDTTQISRAVSFWVNITAPVPKPKIFGFNETEGHCLQRLNWTKNPARAGTPHFDQLLSRISNADALKKWIGSLFFSGADTQQYVYLVGKGGDGKSALTRFLGRVFGTSYKSDEVPDSGMARFWASTLLGKRLVVFNDVANTSFAKSSLFKQATGGDAMRIEEKFKSTYTARMSLKFMFTSNEDPDISSSEADQRRIIYCRFTRGGSYQRGFEDRLWEEGNEFIMSCIDLYLSTNSDHSPIATDRDEAMEVASALEDEMEVALENSFKIEEGAKTLPKEFQMILENSFASRKERLEFSRYIKRRFGIRKVNVREGNAVRSYYVGIKPKNHITAEIATCASSSDRFLAG